MKKIILIFLTVFVPLLATADAVEIGGIYYNLIPKGHIAEVASNPNRYKGNIVIPNIVNYQDSEYIVTSIGYHAFSYSSGLTSVTIPNSVTSIGDYAFENSSGLTIITIPNSVTSIGKGVFHNCSGLTSVTIPNSVTHLGESTFSYCSGLTSVTIPNSVTAIGDRAFYHCSGLTSVTIPNSVTSIGESTFCWCSGLTSVTIPNSVTSIGVSAFALCGGLTSVTISNSVTAIGDYAFDDCYKLTSITIPNSVTAIGESAFRFCSGLTSITIPNFVTAIGESAFEGCQGLVSISIGDGIKVINEKAFENCTGLTDVTCLAKNPPFTYNNAFLGSYIEYATLHVPSSSVEQYRNATPWCDFGNVVTMEGGDTPKPKTCSKPTISYVNGRLNFDCETEGVQFVSEIKDDDIRKYYDASLSLTATYNISVYATKVGYEDSEAATATLCWIDAEPMQEGTIEAEDGVTEVKAIPVLIRAEGNTISVQGATEGTDISVYNTAGIKLCSTIANKGMTTLNTQLPSGSTAIVKIGEKTVKVLVK